MKYISDFSDEYAFLSNFYAAPITNRTGRVWRTSEHAFQAAKARTMQEAEYVRTQHTPGAAKRAGHTISMRSDWDDIKIKVMRTCLFMKFMQNEKLMHKLLSTEHATLIEGNTWHDNYWGVCSCRKCKGLESFNMLGILLMELRDWRNACIEVQLWGVVEQYGIFSEEVFLNSFEN